MPRTVTMHFHAEFLEYQRATMALQNGFSRKLITVFATRLGNFY